MMVACLGEAGFPLGWNVKELVLSIIPALVTMQVLKQQGRWPGAGGVYGGYPVSSCYEVASYDDVAPSYDDGCDSPVSGRVGYSDKEARVLAVLAGVIGVILGGGTLVSCICTRHWGLCVATCIVLALYAGALYFFFKYIRS